ncbi:MAG: hypothetical protein AMJ90_00250 [candidate division Zixibacteria bacterium SM23_73_2]|nr:MAG: hypothetical protein AMJ90_00250 [candidate division Zixibacteria bacterium SM23_73_2]
MFYKKIPNGYIVRLEAGEEVISSLSEFAKKEKILGGFLFGLGAIKDATLGYFDVKNREYIKKTFDDEYEISSLVGDIYYFEGKPDVHAHVTLSGRDFKVIGGHLFSATVTGTGEFFICVSSDMLQRKKDPQTGLNLLDL